GEVREERGKTVTGDEALVHDRPGRGRRDRQVAGPPTASRPARNGLDPAAGADQGELERLEANLRRAADDHMRDIGKRLRGLLTKRPDVDWDVAPPRPSQPLR